jgi:hypothetical protein
MRRLCTVIALVALLLPNAPAAWEVDIHRLITLRAIDGLRGPVRQVLVPFRTYISEHSIDPDQWRVVGLSGVLGPEPPNHFLDIDALDEPPPFTGVPREWDAFVKRYGAERADRAGRLPWRVEEIYGRLVSAFRGVRNKTPPYAADNARYLSAVIAHYVEDGFQPLHAVGNYDGQLTNQRGIHARFEGELARRHWPNMRHPPVRITPIANPKTFMFDTLTESAGLAQVVLEADRKAANGTTNYDARYYSRFLAGARDVLEARLNGAASGVASLITAAWDESAKAP